MMRDDPEYHYYRKSEWYMRTRETRLVQMRNWRRSIHASAIKNLGSKCSCCAETHVTMLEVDHVNNDGASERREDNRNNFRTYQRIRDFPESRTRYQVLCSNCNHSKLRNRGICEHKTEQRLDRFARFKRRFDFAPFGVA